MDPKSWKSVFVVVVIGSFALSAFIGYIWREPPRFYERKQLQERQEQLKNRLESLREKLTTLEATVPQAVADKRELTKRQNKLSQRRKERQTKRVLAKRLRGKIVGVWTEPVFEKSIHYIYQKDGEYFLKVFLMQEGKWIDYYNASMTRHGSRFECDKLKNYYVITADGKMTQRTHHRERREHLPYHEPADYTWDPGEKEEYRKAIKRAKEIRDAWGVDD